MTGFPVSLVSEDKYQSDIFSRFMNQIEGDRASGRLNDWMVSWYWKELFPQFGDSQTYNGPGDLVRWFLNQSLAHRYPTPPDLTGIEPRIALQEAGERRMFADPAFARYAQQIERIDYANHAAYSAQDHYFASQHFPSGPPRAVLDFGPGCGRMARQWVESGTTTYIGVEGIPETYCLQHLYYSFLDLPLTDYVIAADAAFPLNTPGIIHLPSWRTDLLPDQSIDLCSAVQVLGELRPEMLEFVVGEFHRLLRPGAFLYLRDHGKVHVPNKMDIPKLLTEAGFTLIFEAKYADRKEIHGIPKVWQKSS